jgi:hypothetical protein
METAANEVTGAIRVNVQSESLEATLPLHQRLLRLQADLARGRAAEARVKPRTNVQTANAARQSLADRNHMAVCHGKCSSRRCSRTFILAVCGSVCCQPNCASLSQQPLQAVTHTNQVEATLAG